MNRLWSRVGIRVTSVGLLVAGVIGGIYLGQDQGPQPRSAPVQPLVLVDADELQLLQERRAQAAARALRRQAVDEAADAAAAGTAAAADTARKREKQTIADKAAAEKAKAEKEAADKAKEAEKSKDPGTSGPSVGPIPDSCDEFSGNRATGCALLLKAGFDIDQFPCLNKLWNKESNWRHKASNRSSGAYGIPQALPGSKMATVASDWRTNPATQIKWGLDYIEGRYGTPCSAWSHSRAKGWY